MKLSRVSILLFLLLFGVALADKLNLSASLTPTGMVIRSDSGLIRYNVDYLNHAITLLNANLSSVNAEGTTTKLEDNLPIGASAVVQGENVRINFPYPFAVTQSPDARLITITRGDLQLGNLGPSDPRAPLIIPLAYADPAFIAGFLTRSYNIKVDVDPRQRAIIIFVPSADEALIRQVVASLDLPRPQVAFEAEILEVNQQAALSLGIDYEKLLNIRFTLTEQAIPGSIQLGDFSRSGISINLGLDLLKSTNVGRVLARPRVTTTDGIEANLRATQTYSILTTNNGVSTLTSVTTGVSLRLLPKVSPDLQSVESSLTITVSSPASISGGTVSYSSRDASTTVRVRNGEPIVIGGLLQNQQTTSTAGIPGLSDIPILGELFKNTKTVNNYTDLVIVVTPYIIVPATAAPKS